MKLFKLLILAAFFQSASAQIKVTAIDKKSIPASIHYIGNIINATRYVDKEGEHIIITTETGIVKDNKNRDDDFSKADLYAYNYKIENNKPTLLWQMHDYVNYCSFDVTVNYIPSTFAITDLNNDEIGEVWLMYDTGCRSDVSPLNMKIIMHEGIKKYAVRGTNKSKISAKDFVGGEYTLDETFKNGPETFRQYAIQLWKKNILGKW